MKLMGKDSEVGDEGWCDDCERERNCRSGLVLVVVHSSPSTCRRGSKVIACSHTCNLVLSKGGRHH